MGSPLDNHEMRSLRQATSFSICAATRVEHGISKTDFVIEAIGILVSAGVVDTALSGARTRISTTLLLLGARNGRRVF